MRSNLVALRRLALLTAIATQLALFSSALACDPCALYSATRLLGASQSSTTIGISEQFTALEQSSALKNQTIRDGEVTTDFSTTQFYLSHDLTERFSLQATLPFIIRRFDRYSKFTSRTSHETGLGDMTLSAGYQPIVSNTPESAVIWSIFGGLKLPTGDTGAIENSDLSVADENVVGENAGVDQSEPNLLNNLRHHPSSSAMGGRVLSLGSGSYDFPVGSSLMLRQERIFLLTSLQYTFRTEGDFDYRFGNELVWDFGPGYFFVLEHESSLAARVVMSGEYKRSDKLNGSDVQNSAVSNLFLGPEILFTASESITGQFAIDLPVYRDDSENTLLPEWRIRAAVSYRF